MINLKVRTVLKNYKSNFYQKSLQLRTDFSLYNKYFKEWHARYFDVIRRTKYQEEKRDYKKLRFNTQDPLFFDQKSANLNGGIQRLVETIDKEVEVVISPYRCIYLMYNMAKYDYMNKQFFVRMDSVLNTAVIDQENLIARYPYAALYSYYKFNLGRAENVSYFERCMPEYINSLHYFEILDLLEVMCDSTLYPKEHFDHQFNLYIKPSIVEGFEKEFSNRQQTLYKLAVLLRKFGCMDGTLWDLWVNRVVKIKRVQNIEDFHKFLQMLLWANEYPKSPKFGLIEKEIELFKEQIRRNPNRLWKYDVDKAAFRTYQDLLLTRDEIDDTFEIGAPIPVEVKKDEDVKYEEKDQATVAKETFDKLISEKKNIKDIIGNLSSYGFNPILIDNIVSEYIESNQKIISEKLDKEGKIGKKEKKEKKKKKIAAPGGKPGEKAAAGGKKK